MPKVLVLGASGHLGRNLVLSLLQKGYEVRSGVRALLHPLPVWRGRKSEEVYTDILNPQTLDAAMEGVEGIFHCAAPTQLWAKHPKKEICDPIVKGTLEVINAAHRNKISSIIYTSSCAAVGFHAPLHRSLSELDWNYDTQHPQFQSKVQAEKQGAARAKKYGISFIRVCPPSILGPGFYRHTPSTKPYEALLKGKRILVPDLAYHVMDVRDLAAAQILLYEKIDANDRYIVCGAYTGTREILGLVQKKIPTCKKPVLLSATGLNIAWGIEWMQHHLIGTPRSLTRALLRECVAADQRLDASRFMDSCKEMWKVTPLENTLWDMVEWMRKTKIV